MQSILTNLGILSSILPIAFFFILLKRNTEKRLWVIPLYLCASLITDLVIMYIHSKGYRKEQYYISTSFTFLEVSLFTYYVYPFFTRPVLKKVTTVLYSFAVMFGLLTLLSTRGNFNDRFAAGEEITIIFICVLFFYDQVNNPDVTFLYASKEFWIVFSLFFYSAATLFLFISTSLLTVEIAIRFWSIAQIASIVKNILMVIAFYKPLSANRRY